MKILFATILLFAFCIVSTKAQSDWNTYTERTISTLIKQHDNKESQKADMVISADPFPSKTRIIFTGKHRPIDVNERIFIKLWLETRGLSVEGNTRLQEEFQVVEDGVEYWLPTEKKSEPKLNALKAGDEIMIYYFFIGGFNERKIFEKTPLKDRSGTAGPDRFKWVFVLETFGAGQSQQSVQDSFTPQSLKLAIENDNGGPEGSNEVWFSPRQIRSKTKVRFTGDIRDMSEMSGRLVAIWLEKNGLPPDAIGLMRREARFIEGDKEYWIVMRNAVLDDIVKKVGKDGDVFLNTILLGKAKNNKADYPVFLCGYYLL